MERRGEISVFATLEEILRLGQKLQTAKVLKTLSGVEGMPLLDGDQVLLQVASAGLIANGDGQLSMPAPDDATTDLVFNHGELYRRFGLLDGAVKLLIVTGLRQAMLQEGCDSVLIMVPWSDSKCKKVRVRCSLHSPDVVAKVNEALVSRRLYFALEGTA